MIGDIQRYSESARRVLTWALLAALKENTSEIGTIHILSGIHQEKPAIFGDKDPSQVGLSFSESSLEELPKLREAMIRKTGAAQQGVGRDEMTIAGLPSSPGARRALEIAHEYSKQLGTYSTGVVHLLWGIFQADSSLRSKLEKLNISESQLESLSRSYKDNEEGESGLEMVRKMSPRWRSGIGYDLHRLAPGRPLILGGVEVPFEKGPVGHSDGDALAHAICDAILGAAGLGDIGTHFPDTDPKWKGVSSLLFLEHARKLLANAGLRISHLDAVVITEKPKLGPHFPAIRKALAQALGVTPEQINLKAKTNEGVDAIGRGEAIAAQAIATLEG